MFDPAWEDSLLTTDLEDIRAIEAMERYHASAKAIPRTCRLAKCRRHRVCLGPMLQPPGLPLPPRYHQHRDQGFRVLCILESDPPLKRLKLQTILNDGPDFYAWIIRHPLIRPEDFLAYRIAASRQARRAAKERPRST